MLVASAQPAYQSPYTPPKLVSRATGSVEPAGKGSVTVQVQLDAHGKVESTRILSSTSNEDNAAALDIAQHSTYTAATRGGKGVRSIYDYVINFGQSVVSGAASQIDGLLHQSQWRQARDAATAALAKNPNDQIVQAQLGVAYAFLHDINDSASAFEKAGPIPTQYASVASQAYAINAENIAASAPTTALVQAQKAISLSPNDCESYYALAVAQHANNLDADAGVSLQKAQSLLVTASPPADTRTKMKIATEQLVLAIAHGDNATAQQVQKQIDALDPTHQLSQKITAYYYDQLAVAAMHKSDSRGAIAMFEKAGSTDPQWAAGPEYTKAAILYINLSVPDYLAAKGDADKAIAGNPNFAMADYVAGVALARAYLQTGNEAQDQDASIYLNKAVEIAQKSGDTELARLADHFQHNRTTDANLQTIATQLTINPNNTGQSEGDFQPMVHH